MESTWTDLHFLGHKCSQRGSTMPSKFSSAIKAGLAVKGISQASLAKKIEVKPMTVTRWVKDSSWPDKESLDALRSFFNWSDQKIHVMKEDWIENRLGNRKLRLAGAEFVQAEYGNDYEKLLEVLISLDESTIVGINVEHEGTPDQWAPIFQSSPYTWRLMLCGDEIIGYWQFMCIKKEYYEGISSGSIVDSEIRADMMDVPVMPDKYFGYFCVIAIKSLYQGGEAFSLINKSLTARIADFSRHGILFEKFFATAFTFEGIRMCERFGMTRKGRHPRAAKSEIADMFEITGPEIKGSYWGRNMIVQRAYREAFG